MQDLEAFYRAEAGRVRASLIRLLGSFELAEEALHDAFMAAAESWQRDGVPKNPRSWLISVGRFKAIDRLRGRARFDKAAADLQRSIEDETGQPADAESITDDSLRLVFVCCHPVLPLDVQVAMTLREVCGLTTEEIARAFLVPATTIAQRIVRGKHRIREAGLAYEVPGKRDLPERLDGVLRVIYLVFNEGYSASSGPLVTRIDLAGEAIRLGRLVDELLPEAEVRGLLALMLLQHSRARARMSPEGEVILLSRQDRSLWDQGSIGEALVLVGHASRSGQAGPYAIQAAIAAVHAQAASVEATDWGAIVGLYDRLLAQAPSPVVELNRAVAVAERDGAQTGLLLIEAILSGGKLDDYVYAHAARAELLVRLGRREEAQAAYARALDRASQEPERRFLKGKLKDLG